MKTSEPEEVGISRGRLKRIALVMQDYIDAGKLAGVVTLIARHEKIVHFERFGLGFRVVTDQSQYGLLGSEGLYAWGGAASTGFFVDPHEQLIGIIMPQFRPSTYYPIRNQFEVLVNQALVE